MMPLFDQFGPAQVGNGQGPPNMPPVGAPGFNFQNWGHVPPNMAGGLQQFLKGNAPTNPGMPQTNGPMPGTPQTGMFGAPAGQSGGLPTAGGPQMSTGFMPPPQTGAPAGASAPQMVAPAAASAPDAATASGNTGFAGGMQQYLGMMRPR